MVLLVPLTSTVTQSSSLSVEETQSSSLSVEETTLMCVALSEPVGHIDAFEAHHDGEVTTIDGAYICCWCQSLA